MKQCLIIVITLLISAIELKSQNLMMSYADTLHSITYEEERSFRIALPSSYGKELKFNVIYVLDADYLFDVVAANAIYLQTYDYIPPTAVVAVDYAIPGQRSDIGFNMTDLSLNQTGDNFYRYLNDEVIPHIGTIIPATGFNTLVGHSYTATYLCSYINRRNRNFNSYILFAPEYTDVMPLSDFRADSLQSQNKIRVFAGKYDVPGRIDYANRLASSLKVCGFKDVKSEILPADHMSIIPDGSVLALKQLYDSYWNMQKIDGNKALEAEPGIWNVFQKCNNRNLQYYKQPLQVNSTNTSFFLSRAINAKDTLAINKLTDYYLLATAEPFDDIYTLSVIADVLRKINRFDLSATYFSRYLRLCNEKNLNHETWYARRIYAIKILAEHFGDYDAAWNLLEESKHIFPDDSLAFCYYQGVISSNHNYKLIEGAHMLQSALTNEVLLKDNFIAPEEAFYLLAKIMFMSKRYSDAEKYINEAINRSSENEEFIDMKIIISKKTTSCKSCD